MGNVVDQHSAASSALPLKQRLELVVEREGNKRFRTLGAALYRLTSGHMTRLWQKQDVTLLTTRGRHSGRKRTVILQFFRDGADVFVVAANSGNPSRNPDWYFNLKSSPEAVVQFLDRRFSVQADELSSDAAAVLWSKSVLAAAPDYAKYTKVSGRPIPCIRLRPTAPGDNFAPPGVDEQHHHLRSKPVSSEQRGWFERGLLLLSLAGLPSRDW